MYRALLFDVFGTVVDWRQSVARQAAARFGATRDWAAFADAWRARYQPAMEAVRRGERPFVPLDVLHRENLDAIAPDFGLESLDAAERAAVTRFWHRLDPWPDSVPGLKALKERYIITAHSNGNVALMVNLARHGKLPWDMILGAEVTGHYKPLPASYRRACQLLDVPVEQCLMVAAHNGDLKAARACGLGTAFVPRPTEYGLGQRSDLAPEDHWDVVAKDLVDLAHQLAGLNKP
ncbi:MAG: haloacid dehalogenase type II [Candidatus Competibacterales bacterium]